MTPGPPAGEGPQEVRAVTERTGTESAGVWRASGGQSGGPPEVVEDTVLKLGNICTGARADRDSGAPLKAPGVVSVTGRAYTRVICRRGVFLCSRVSSGMW